MTEPTTMQWVVYDMQTNKAVKWHWTALAASHDANARERARSPIPANEPAGVRFMTMSRAVLLRISKTGN